MCSVSNQIRMPIKKQDSCTTPHISIHIIYTLDCVEHHFYFRSNTPYSSIVDPSCCNQLFIVLDIQKINIVSRYPFFHFVSANKQFTSSLLRNALFHPSCNFFFYQSCFVTVIKDWSAKRSPLHTHVNSYAI